MRAQGAGLAPDTPSAAAKGARRRLMIASAAARGPGVEPAAVRRAGPRVLATIIIAVPLLVLLCLTLMRVRAI